MMKEKDLNEVIKRLAKTASQKKSSHDSDEVQEKIASTTFPPIKEVSHSDVAVNFNIHFVKSNAQVQFQHKNVIRSQPRVIREILEKLSPGEQKELRAIDLQIIKWIDENDEHAAMFFSDPLKALEKAGVKLDPVLLRKIKQQRSNSLKFMPTLPRAKINSIKVDAVKHGK